ncbi:MAG: hypothetical protein GTN80_02915, partial [Nitrososphaeria archaeon]|nr:hypothetical protein [Nitrososphaeria archaeon]NIQ32586.1 hypothetical protein [Nitrososphaeria archaeon]
WVVIDLVYGNPASPGLDYNVEVRGRYFFPDEDDHEIRIEIFDLDTDSLAPGDSRHDIPISEHSSGILLEDFIPTAPMDEFRWLNLTAMVYQRTGPPLSFELVDEMPFYVSRLTGPVDFSIIEIDHIGTAPEVEYGNPVDLGVRVNYVFPPEDTEFNIYIFQIGGLSPLASESSYGRGDDWQLIELSIPPERVPPRNGEWNLEAHASTIGDYHTYRFDLNVIGADEGISGGSSDWMLLDGWPSNPIAIEGEAMLFWAVIGLETTDDLPQQVWLILEIDGVEIVREAVTYLDGLVQLDFQSISPWIATPGSHMAVWTVDPDEDYVDPDRDNNQLEFTFEVAEAMPLSSDGIVPGEEPPEPEEEFNFYVTADPTEGTLASSETYSVSVELVSGESQLVRLSLIGAPAGLSYSFNPSAGEPPYDSILTVTGSDSLPAGTYSMIINATDGVRIRYKPIILYVEEGADYELSISPSSIRGKPGDIVEFTISATSDSGYDQLVNLVVSGVPGGVVGELEPSAEEPDFQSILSFYIGEDAVVGIHDIFVTGSGIEPRQVHSTLIVEDGVEDGTVREDRGRNLS